VLRVSHSRLKPGRCPGYDHGPRQVEIATFALGRFPVTNGQFATFMAATRYRPEDSHNFLRHWENGSPPADKRSHPVVWVSPRDAEAYLQWAGLRLPTDLEWQWAALGDTGDRWPWGPNFLAGHCNPGGAGTTPVDAFPQGAAASGCLDLVGNTWEWTGPEYDDGWHQWRLIRGGSYFRAAGSKWYVDGGLQPANMHQRFLLQGEGLNRCATVGFRAAGEIVT